SIQVGDSYRHHFLVGPTGSPGSPAAGSVLASNLFSPGHRTMLLVWWDEYDPAPIMFYRPGLVKQALISASDVYDEYSVLHLMENNWGLPTLTANDAAASPIAEIFGSSTPPRLATSFTVSPPTTIAQAPVSFYATTPAVDTPYTINWNFCYRTTGTGTSIQHVYSSAQSFSLTETATDSSSPSQNAVSSQTITISAPPPPSTSFTFLPATPVVNSPVTFIATTSGETSPYSVTWNFGDGASGTGSSVTHTFTSAQSFTVRATATDSSTPTQTATSSQSVTVVATLPLSATLQVSSSSPEVGQPVTFSASATGETSPYTYAIAFGDGATGTGSTTTHAYSTPGSYTARMTVTDLASTKA